MEPLAALHVLIARFTIQMLYEGHRWAFIAIMGHPTYERQDNYHDQKR